MVDVADLDRPQSAEESAAPEPVLLRSDADGVVRLTLNRPQAYNSLSRELLGRLADGARPDRRGSPAPGWS